MTKAMIIAFTLATSTAAQACYVGIDCSMSDYVRPRELVVPEHRQDDWFGDAMRRGDRDFHDWEVDNRLDRLENEMRYEREFGPRFGRDR
jgi:hypothetical protein